MTTVADASPAKDTRARLPISEVRWSTVLAPLAVGVLALLAWEWLVDALAVTGSNTLSNDPWRSFSAGPRPASR